MKSQATHRQPRALTLSRNFRLFLKHGGQISVQLTGKRKDKGIGDVYVLSQEGVKNTKTERTTLNDKEDKEAS